MKLAALTISTGIALGLLANGAKADPIFDTGKNLQHYAYNFGSGIFRAWDYDRIFTFSFEVQHDYLSGGYSYDIQVDNRQVSTQTIERDRATGRGQVRDGQSFSFNGAGTLSDWSFVVADIEGTIGSDMTLSWFPSWREGNALYVGGAQTVTLRGTTVRQWVSAPGVAALLSMGLLGLWRAMRDQAN